MIIVNHHLYDLTKGHVFHLHLSCFSYNYNKKCVKIHSCYVFILIIVRYIIRCTLMKA